MQFEYKNKTYMLGELREINGNCTHDIAVVMEEKGKDYRFVDYFWGVCGSTTTELIDRAKKVIDLKDNDGDKEDNS